METPRTFRAILSHVRLMLLAITVCALPAILPGAAAATTMFGLDEPRLMSSADQQVRVAVTPAALTSGLVSTAVFRERVDRLVASVAAREGDLIVWMVDESGHPLRPDFDTSHSNVAANSTALQFTFNSPQQPWTPSQLATLNTWLADFIPLIDVIYGPPAFGVTVNVRKDTTQTFAAAYYSYYNEMVIGNITADAFCHEIIHAYHDDAIFGFASYEEGITRAAEIAVFDASPYYHWDKYHSNNYDYFYDQLNVAGVASTNGNVFAGSVRTLVRYQLAGYAWGKLFLERSTFFQEFNRLYLERFLADPSVSSSEAVVTSIAAAVSPTCEGQAFRAWWARQYVLALTPPPGLVVYQRNMQYDGRTLTDVYVRDSFGNELPQSDGSVSWEARSFTGALLDHGSVPLNASGFAWIDPPQLPVGYHGRLKIVTKFTGVAGTASTETIRPDTRYFSPTLAGICATVDTGTVIVTAMDTLAAPVSVSVIDGAFEAPSLLTLRGRIRLELRSGGFRGARIITKDRSGYTPLLAATNLVDVVEPDDARPTLEIRPSVTHSRTHVRLGAPLATPARLTIVDVAGRVVRTMIVPEGRAGIEWDGTATNGDRVAPGLYLIRLDGRGPSVAARVIVLH